MTDDASVTSSNFDANSEIDIPSSTNSMFSVSRILNAIGTNNLSQLEIPSHTEILEMSGFKLQDSIDLRKIIDISPSIFETLETLGECSLELRYIDNKQKSLFLLVPSVETFEYYPYNGKIFPNTILENWLIALRQANNLNPFIVNSI